MGYKNKIEQSLSDKMRYGIVTFMDIIGWKGIWKRERSPVIDYFNITNLLEVLSNKLERGRESLKKEEIDETNFTKITILSDTIIITSPITKIGNETENFELPEFKETIFTKLDTHFELCSSAIAKSIDLRIPLRGAISFGKYYNEENTFIGPAIDDVASWYEAADWFGVLMTPSFKYILEKDIHSKSFEYGWGLYHPPMKNNIGKIETYCLNWFKKMDNPDYPDYIKKVFWNMNTGVITPDIIAKYENTISFIENEE